MKKCNQLSTLISTVFIVMSVSAYGENPLSPEELEKYITDNAQAIVDAGEYRAALKRQIQQLQEENKQLKETVDKLAARLEDYAKDQQTKHSEDIAGLQKQITDNKSTANTAVYNASAAKEYADDIIESFKLPSNYFKFLKTGDEWRSCCGDHEPGWTNRCCDRGVLTCPSSHPRKIGAWELIFSAGCGYCKNFTLCMK